VPAEGGAAAPRARPRAPADPAAAPQPARAAPSRARLARFFALWPPGGALPPEPWHVVVLRLLELVAAVPVL
jgi:hypothetical protein